MRFQIESSPFIELLQIVIEKMGPQQGEVHMVVTQDQVCIESKEIAAEMEALVAEEGQCWVCAAEVLRALKKQRAKSLLVKGGRHGLYIGGLTLRVERYCSEAPIPSNFQVFFTSNHGLVHAEPIAG